MRGILQSSAAILIVDLLLARSWPGPANEVMSNKGQRSRCLTTYLNLRADRLGRCNVNVHTQYYTFLAKALPRA